MFRSFLRQNPCSSCNSEVDLVVALGKTFFQLCSTAEQISSVRKIDDLKPYLNHPVVVQTNHRQSFIAFSAWKALLKGTPFLLLELFVPNDSAFI